VGRNRFVKPGTTRLDISDSDWFEVKDKLSYGEEQKLAGAMTPSMTPGTKTQSAVVDLDWGQYAIERLLVWVVDWSFEDDNGKQQKVTKDTIFSLDAETVEEMDAALERHIAEMEEKKGAQIIKIVSKAK
jgi:hypothetical protein